MNPKEDPIEPKKNKFKWLFKKLINKYIIVFIVFLVWILFFDQNSWLIHRELDKEINKLKREKKYYQEKLDKENEQIYRMRRDTTEIERVAREKHFLKKENEDVFIIEVQKNKNKQTNGEAK